MVFSEFRRGRELNGRGMYGRVSKSRSIALYGLWFVFLSDAKYRSFLFRVRPRLTWNGWGTDRKWDKRDRL